MTHGATMDGDSVLADGIVVGTQANASFSWAPARDFAMAMAVSSADQVGSTRTVGCATSILAIAAAGTWIASSSGARRTRWSTIAAKS